MKNYIGISRDHSGSMSGISRFAARDYNDTIASLQENSQQSQIDTIVSVTKCGVGRTTAAVVREIVNSNANILKPIPEHAYITDGGGTPLFDSVGDLIEQFKNVPDYSDPAVSFLVMAITDGHENSSRKWNAKSISAEIRQLQATDRWTFVFRVPRGHAASLIRMGIPEGNVLEWDQTQKGVETSTVATRSAFTQYYAARSAGKTSTQTFYADLKNVTTEEVKAATVDISKEVSIWHILSPDDGSEIKPFIDSKLTSGKRYQKGAAFYQLTKPERAVQDYKMIALRDKSTGAVFAGPAARQLLGLPRYGNCALRPGDSPNYDIYVQSTSLNRKLTGGSSVLYWEGALQYA